MFCYFCFNHGIQHWCKVKVKKKEKLSLYQAMETHRVVRR
jgi:hypothetical protein